MKTRYRYILPFLFLFACSVSAKGDENVLRWAADAESGVPYVFADPKIPTKLIGFEVDIIKAVAKELGMEERHVQNEWDGLVPGLSRNDYDVVINGIEVTRDREQVVDFSIPYYLTYQQLVVRSDETEINGLEGLNGRRVGTLKGALAERILRDYGTIKVVTYSSELNSYSDLANRRIDAVLIDHPVAMYYASWNKKLKFVGQPIGEIRYAIAMKKGRTELLEKINGAIAKLISTGQLRKIYDEWNIWNYLNALYWGDKAESKTEPVKYDEYISSLGAELTFDDYYDRYAGMLPIFGKAALTTVEISVLSMLLAVFFGLVLALMKIYGPRWVSLPVSWFIEVIRGTPLLIQLFFIYYTLPVIGITFDPILAAVLGLGINYAAYEAENYRAGLFSVPRGQMEAALSLGMGRRQALKHIILPQAIRLVIPPVTNDFISLLKDSSLVSVITMIELTKVYLQLSSTYYDYIGTGIIVAAIYLLLGLPFVRLSKWAEERYSLDKRKKPNHLTS